MVFNVLDLAVLKTNSYFCIGSVVPNFPDPPKDVTKQFSNFKSANTSGLRNSGVGFCYGMQAEFDAEIGNKSIAGVSAKCILGFDIMLLKYKDLECTNSNGQIGINGWYANGQAYILASGALYVAGIDLVSATLAALVEVKLPNPLWARGHLYCGIETFLGDLSFNTDFKVGELCNPKSNNAISVDLISTIAPSDQMDGVSEESSPTVILNYPAGSVIEIVDVNGTDTKKYKVVMDSLEFTSDNDENLDFEIVSDKSGRTIDFKIKNLLKSEGSYHLSAQYSLLDEDNNVVYTESEGSSFKVRKYELKNIPLSNVKASYPIINQANFLKKEWKEQKGFIVLNFGQPDILIGDDGMELHLRLRNTTTESQILLNANYDAINREIDFDLPQALLSNNTTYLLELISKSKLKSNNVEGNQVEGGENLLLSYKFKTSLYDNFTEKMDALKLSSNFISNSYYGEFYDSRIFINQYNSTNDNFEGFDEIERSSLVDYNITPPKAWLDKVNAKVPYQHCVDEYEGNNCFSNYLPTLTNRLTDHILIEAFYTNSDPSCNGYPRTFKYNFSFYSPNFDNDLYGTKTPKVPLDALYKGELVPSIFGNAKANNNPPLGPGIFTGNGGDKVISGQNALNDTDNEIEPSNQAFTYVWQTARLSQLAKNTLADYKNYIDAKEAGNLFDFCFDFNKGMFQKDWNDGSREEVNNTLIPKMNQGTYKLEWKYTIPNKNINTSIYYQNITY